MIGLRKCCLSFLFLHKVCLYSEDGLALKPHVLYKWMLFYKRAPSAYKLVFSCANSLNIYLVGECYIRVYRSTAGSPMEPYKIIDNNPPDFSSLCGAFIHLNYCKLTHSAS